MHVLRVFECLFDDHCVAMDVGSHSYGLAAEVCGVALLMMLVMFWKGKCGAQEKR